MACVQCESLIFIWLSHFVLHTLFFPIRDQRLWRILLETFLLKWAWLEHWIVSRLNGKDPTLWWEVKEDFSFLATVHDLYWITKFILFMYVDDKSCTMCVLSVCTDSSFLLIMKCTNNIFWSYWAKKYFLPLLGDIFLFIYFFLHWAIPIRILLLKNGLHALKYIQKILLFTFGSITQY